MFFTLLSLHIACFNGHSEIVDTLMLWGVNETIINHEWKTPLQVAEKRGYSKLLKLLDKNYLYQAMKRQRDKLKLPLIVLVLLTLRPIRQRPITGILYYKWTAVYVMLTIRNVINTNENSQNKREKIN